MAGMIRLRPTQVILTSEEASKALHKSRPATPESSPLSGPLPWDHNITFRKGRGTKTDKTAQWFDIYEDRDSVCDVDSGEISDMSDFSFGPMLQKRSLSDRNILSIEANSSSEAGDEDSGDGDSDERSSRSTSWDGRDSVRTLTNDSSGDDTLLPSTRIDGSISPTSEQHGLAWDVCSDRSTENELNNAQDDSFIDIEYLADVELSVAGDDGLSGQDSDTENRTQESYSLPMDGVTEHRIRKDFADMHLYASPISPPLDNGQFRSRESSFSWTPGALGTLSGASIPLTPPSVRRLLEEVPPRLEDVAGLSPRHLATSRARLARYHSRSPQGSILARQVSAEEGVDHHRRSRTFDVSLQSFPTINPQADHPEPRAFTLRIAPPLVESSELYTDDSDGGTITVEHSAKTASNGGDCGDCGDDDEGDTDVVDRKREIAAGKLFG